MLRRDRRYDIGCSDPCSSRSGTGLPLRGAIGRFLMNARGRVLARVLFAAATIVVPRVAIVLDLPEARGTTIVAAAKRTLASTLPRAFIRNLPIAPRRGNPVPLRELQGSEHPIS